MDKKCDWLILGLTPIGEQAKRNVIEESLKNLFGKNSQIFFPFKKESDQRYESKALVLEGYIFIKANFGAVNFSEVERLPYVSLLSSKPQYIGDDYVDKLRRELKDICEEEYFPKDFVRITDGPFSRLEGEVIREERLNVYVRITTRSKEIITEIPKTFIERI